MRYLIVILLACSVVLGIMAYYYHDRANSYCELWKNSEANNTYLIKQREKDHADTLAVSIKNRELEEAAKLSSEPCWNRVIPANDTVLVRLQAN